MKNLVYSLIMFLFLITFNLAQATPASNVQLSYNLDTHTLHIEADHPTERMDRYFIGRIAVTLNFDSATTKYFAYPRQNSPSHFAEDLDLQAKGGDHIDIKVFSTEGGIAEASLDVPIPEASKT